MLKTLYQTTDGRTSESKKEALDWQSEIDLTNAVKALIQLTFDPNVFTMASHLIATVNNTKEGYEAVKQLYKTCHKNNSNFTPVRTSSMPSESDMLNELGWEAMDTLKNMVKFCLKMDYATNDAGHHETHMKELIRFSGYVSK